MAERSLPSWHDRVPVAVRAQPGKAIALAVLLAVMAIVWAKTFLGKGRATSSAEAKTTPDAAPFVASPRGLGLAAPAANKALADWLRKPPVYTRRDLFAIRMEYFPTETSPGPGTSDKEEDGFWDQLAKSLNAKADQEKVRRILVQNLKSEAAKLKLQSTIMSGEQPRALVNDTLLSEGDAIGGFRLVKIEPRRIIVEREGVKLEVLFSQNK